MGRVGGKRRAGLYSKAELSSWSKLGGRPGKLDGKALAMLGRLLAKGKTHAECAKLLEVSTRTIGRGVAKGRG
jgi:hypothetical protein